MKMETVSSSENSFDAFIKCRMSHQGSEAVVPELEEHQDLPFFTSPNGRWLSYLAGINRKGKES